MKHDNGPFFFAGLFIAIGLAASGFFIGQTMVNAKVAVNTAEVKGLAERRVSADRANWSIVYKLAVQTRDQVAGLYKQAERQQAEIVATLKKAGFSDDEIHVGAFEYGYYEYRDDDQRLVDQAHQLSGRVDVETAQVERVGKARNAISQLIAKGINIENHAPVYRFTGLNEIKPDMLREATKNAREAANEFAENAGVKVGGIRSARQGGFNIRDAGEEYGDTAKIEKDVRVVTTITFFLTE